jgi:ubiquitin-protein ligase
MQKDTRTTAHGRIQKDLREVNDKLNPDSPPIFALPVGDSLDHVDALIMGPPETPYSFGFFRFGAASIFPAAFTTLQIDLPSSTSRHAVPLHLPQHAAQGPHVRSCTCLYVKPSLRALTLCLCGFPLSSTTTNGGRTRFNPNLYAGGKGIHPSINANAAFTGELWPHHLPPAVCLSILGTWSGESEDEWRSSYSINYVLSAIQSLIMTAKPYHNEPGYEEVPTRACSLC